MAEVYEAISTASEDPALLAAFEQVELGTYTPAPRLEGLQINIRKLTTARAL